MKTEDEPESDSDRRWKRDHEDKGQDWAELGAK
jgi:hypothetical protein